MPEPSGSSGDEESGQCGVEGPNGLTCTRHEPNHDSHVTYSERNGDLFRIEWYEVECNGEPKEEQ